MRHRQRLAATALGLALGAGLLAAAPAQADTASTFAKSSPVKPAASCFTTPDNSERAKGYVQNGGGYAEWYANGEWLEVVDVKSNGRRVVALFRWCTNGQYTEPQWRDSGPDEGRIDSELYNYSFAEGRKIRFVVCEKTSGSNPVLSNCSRVIDTHA
jgi:hypothetical protein